MANLVIKPASGSGNKIVFQNQAGLVDAITVEDSGNTTLAGASNNLGTVTAGSIAGGSITSATTFPAGHVIQTVTKNDFQGTTYMTGQTWTATHNTCAITPIKTSSKILVQFSIPLSVSLSTGWTDGGGAVAIFRDINGGGYPAVGSPTYDFNTGSTAINAYFHINTLSTQGQTT